ncbi:MAG TPA: rRNA maturation RNase YbeY [Candidatus Onthomorpha intestinigallinarum]|uniref:Endoribonuclease YbeY n=1 Tax=Candidatus Onthomorpha intestinigallinarum TaxID=2840880 RepID=A0A9D1RGH3_9BACT|nr:rRNA maturation RNase YbeY [Candidatus Onthomorpha intestinigallinarum]
MAISFSFQKKINLHSRTKLKEWINKTAEQREKKIGNISYIFCSDDELLQINNQYLKHDYYTDVITFDYSEGAVLNGDIFISVDRVRDNAKQVGVTFEEELYRVMIHGVLHLSGVNDKTEQQAKQMRKAEEDSLKLLFG